MATTNALQWNPSGVNQETDAAYLANSQRAGGASDGTDFLSILANKAFYQWSTYITALGQMLANKGYTNSDADLSVLTAVMSNILTEADLLPNLLIIGYSPTPSFNFATANGYQMTLTGNITAAAASGLIAGQLVAFYFVQDGVGGRTVTYPAGFFGGVQPDPAASSTSLMMFRVDLAGNARAIGPLVSNNAVFVGNLLTAQSFTLAAPGTAGQVLTNVAGLFVPRDIPDSVLTVHDVTGTRSFGVPVTNPYGLKMLVTGSGNTSGSSVGSVQALVDGVEVYAMTTGGTVNNGAIGWSFEVPAGSSYVINANTLTNGMGSAVNAVRKWVETTTS